MILSSLDAFEELKWICLSVQDDLRKVRTSSMFDIDKLKSTIKQFVHDWSEAGQAERNSCYLPFFKEIQRLFPSNKWWAHTVLKSNSVVWFCILWFCILNCVYSVSDGMVVSLVMCLRWACWFRGQGLVTWHGKSLVWATPAKATNGASSCSSPTLSDIHPQPSFKPSI